MQALSAHGSGFVVGAVLLRGEVIVSPAVDKGDRSGVIPFGYM